MIESYAFGKIVIDGKEYTGDVIIFSDRIKADWWRKEGHRLHVEDLVEVLEEQPEMLIIGTGYYGYMEVPRETRELLEQRGIEVIAEKTSEACDTYNKLTGNKKAIVALHLTC